MTRLIPEADEVAIRMYRQGHGDCFLLAFPRKETGEPVYMMIDCGYKPGSQIKNARGTKLKIDEVVKDIGRATGNTLDIVAITHEHQDHVNGLKKFKNFAIGEAWFAWTEDGDDALANKLRERHKDQLLGLMEARNQLQGLAEVGNGEADAAVARIDALLELEIGSDPDDDDGSEKSRPDRLGFGASSDVSMSGNKQAMKAIRDKAGRLRFFSPHSEPVEVPDTDGIRVYVLGPPRSEDLLKDEDPKGDAEFPGHAAFGSSSLSFFAALKTEGEIEARGAPFSLSNGIAMANAREDRDYGTFFAEHYGFDPNDDHTSDQVLNGADWRRIDEEWLYSAESFALKLNRGVNNTSLVLAFELPKSGKVLLFAADAQNGNWRSWTQGSWHAGDEEITTKDLLSRTVLYKVGHHGSHNATLRGKMSSDYANLTWMASNAMARDEFTAMIAANRDWAIGKAGWDHPLPSIKAALVSKARGRVLQINEGAPNKPASVPDAEWTRLTDRLTTKDAFIELRIKDTHT